MRRITLLTILISAVGLSIPAYAQWTDGSVLSNATSGNVAMGPGAINTGSTSGTANTAGG
jgi:hypothetical protein